MDASYPASVRAMVGLLLAAACGSPAHSPASVAEPLPDPGDPTAAMRTASFAAAGTVLVAERAVEACWVSTRVLVHVEARLRPEHAQAERVELIWLDARSRRAGTDPACVVPAAYRGDVALLRPGARVAVFADSSPHRTELDVREPALAMTFAAPFDELPALAERLGPEQTMWDWLAPPRPALQRDGDVAVDRATGLVWQHGMAPTPVAEGIAYEYCDALVLGGRSDWRVPSVSEVITLGAAALPSPEDAWFWTWHNGRDAEPWIASFATGDLADTHYDDPDPYGPYRVRCVTGHLAAARRILASPGWVHRGDEAIDLVAELGWAKQPRRAASHAAAQQVCRAPWRLPTLAELRAHALRVIDDETTTLENVLLWAADFEGWHHPSKLLVYEKDHPFAEDDEKVALCVQSRPRARHSAARAYPSGEAFADGAKRYWELGTLAWDGARSYFPDGATASEVTVRDGVLDGPATFYAHDGAKLATLSFRAGLLDGPVAIATAEERVAATAKRGALEGPAEIGAPGRFARGVYASGAWHGTWTLIAKDREIATATYRAGILHGPASKRDNGEWRGSYADGLRDGAWTLRTATARGEGTFVRGTGGWKTWQGRRQTSEHPYARDLLHGELKEWNPTGELVRRIRYEHGAVRAREDVFDDKTRDVWTRTREISYFASGAKKSETELRDGIPHGKHTEWNEQGQIVKTGEFKNRMQDGTWTTRVDATHTIIKVWRNGRLVELPRSQE